MSAKYSLLEVSRAVRFACIAEATACKLGNVHRFRDFDDLTYPQFLQSALAFAEVVEDHALAMGCGELIEACIAKTRRVVGTNTNLGMVLLIAPLAKAALEGVDINDYLDSLTVEDSEHLFAAIRIANPGGLGEAPKEDVASAPTLPPREIMTLAAERDSIALQWSNGFRDVVEFGVPHLVAACGSFGNWEGAIRDLQLAWLSRFPDSLILRKYGPDVAEFVRGRAGEMFERGPINGSTWQQFDEELRANGWNPGTTADLTAACLFLVHLSRKIKDDLPFI